MDIQILVKPYYSLSFDLSLVLLIINPHPDNQYKGALSFGRPDTSVCLAPWNESSSVNSREAELTSCRCMCCVLCVEQITVRERNAEITARFTRLFRSHGSVRVRYSGNKQMYKDPLLFVCFKQTVLDVSERHWSGTEGTFCETVFSIKMTNISYTYELHFTNTFPKGSRSQEAVKLKASLMIWHWRNKINRIIKNTTCALGGVKHLFPPWLSASVNASCFTECFILFCFCILTLLESSAGKEVGYGLFFLVPVTGACATPFPPN